MTDNTSSAPPAGTSEAQHAELGPPTEEEHTREPRPGGHPDLDARQRRMRTERMPQGPPRAPSGPPREIVPPSDEGPTDPSE
jgi:hypothetical protein